ncbi:hypothetical protein G6F40_016251 [Rhizopus arrhizus]|nr:hypothetical protein G6F40_016251 [Rhizopus arrhizus]
MHQRRTDALPLPSRQYRDRTEAEPAAAAIADRHRRNRDMANPLAIDLCHQRNRQLAARAQCIDDEVFGVAAVLGGSEGCGCQRMDGGDVGRGFIAEGVVQGAPRSMRRTRAAGTR